jgi:hypothetical protein
MTAFKGGESKIGWDRIGGEGKDRSVQYNNMTLTGHGAGCNRGCVSVYACVRACV